MSVYCPSCKTVRELTDDGKYCVHCGQYLKEMAKEGEFPTCEKLRDHGDEWNHISYFKEWLQYEKKIALCSLVKEPGEIEQYLPIGRGIESLLYEYLEINTDLLEQERRRILDQLREANNPPKPEVLKKVRRERFKESW